MTDKPESDEFFLKQSTEFAGALLVPYLILLVFLVHNITRYLIRQKKYTQLHITLFYVLATTTVIMRLAFILTVIFRSQFFSPLDDYAVECLFSMLQYWFFLQQICSFLELKETLVTFSKLSDLAVENNEYQLERTKLLRKIRSIRRCVLVFAILGFISIIVSTVLYKLAVEKKIASLYYFLVIYWIFVCAVLWAQIVYTNVKLYQTFKMVFDGEIGREDKQILFYVLIFSICYLFMALSNGFKIANDPFETLQFNLGAYFLQDFASIAYLAWVHQLSYSGWNRTGSSLVSRTPSCNRSERESVKNQLSDFYLREKMRLESYEASVHSHSHEISNASDLGDLMRASTEPRHTLLRMSFSPEPS